MSLPPHVIVLTGPPSSGKTSILTLLSRNPNITTVSEMGSKLVNVFGAPAPGAEEQLFNRCVTYMQLYQESKLARNMAPSSPDKPRVIVLDRGVSDPRSLSPAPWESLLDDLGKSYPYSLSLDPDKVFLLRPASTFMQSDHRFHDECDVSRIYRALCHIYPDAEHVDGTWQQKYERITQYIIDYQVNHRVKGKEVCDQVSV